MSRLSLKPGGEPGMWIVKAGRWLGSCIEEGPVFSVNDVPDEDLIDIRSTLNEYLDAKYEVCSGEPTNREPFRPPLSEPKGQTLFTFKFPLWKIAAGVAAISLVTSFLWAWIMIRSVPPVSTGGVIDQLCMRPDIECSTSIRYVHPQAGVPHQERETYSADSLSQAHLEEQ